MNFDSNTYMGRNTVGRSFGLFKQWRAIATRYDKLALTYMPSSSGYANKEKRPRSMPAGSTVHGYITMEL